MIKPLLFACCLAVISGALVNAAEPPSKMGQKEIITAKTYFSTDKLVPDQESLVAVEIEVQKGWHIYANPALPDYVYPTKLTITGTQGTKLESVQYPAGKRFEDPVAKEVMSVYDGKVIIWAKVKAPATAAGMEEELTIIVDHQGCDDKQCLPPTKLKIVHKIQVAKPGESIKPINSELFAKKTPK
jgi:DsbC/DsbD-like thiol-disulfide interchange protein